MPVMAIYERQDVSSELYSPYRELVPLDAAPPGALVHAHAREGSGFVTVDLWETRASLDRFIAERVKPACRTLGVEFVAPKILEVETFRATPGATAQKHLLPFEKLATA